MPGGQLLGDMAPNFEANTTAGRIHLQDFLGNSRGILFSHPRDPAPVCCTELGRAAKLAPEFAKRNVKLIPIALSIDSVEDHLAWSKGINAYNGEEPTEKLPFPIIKDEKDMPVTAHVVFIVAVYHLPATTGRNFDETLRVVTSLQLTAEKRVATPVDWKDGGSVMVLPTIPEEEEFPSGKKHLRSLPQP
uniref:Thioredoxin-dependent peroxide reductase, mitochondrial n=1 Tax=Nomascus leucogenys TaxID=61853 RepID=A0A2I3GMU4_NOMLE